jgi:hypothetical protein
MNDGTMEYSIKTGASLDDLQILKHYKIWLKI